GSWAAGLPGVVAFIDRAAAAVGLDPQMAGSAAAGVIYVSLAGDAGPAAVAAFVAALRDALAGGEAGARPASGRALDGPPLLASAVVVHAPPPGRELVDLWGPAPGLPLMRALTAPLAPAPPIAPP